MDRATVPVYHHHMTPCELWDAQSPARRPHRLVRRFRCVLGESVRRALESARSSAVTVTSSADAVGSAVTVTSSADAVGSSTRRLSHHRMMSGNVCDGLELVRRRYNERLSWISRFPELLGGVPHRCEFSCSQLRFEGSERVVSSQIATSRPGVVVVVENRAPKAFTEPLYHSYTVFGGFGAVWVASCTHTRQTTPPPYRRPRRLGEAHAPGLHASLPPSCGHAEHRC